MALKVIFLDADGVLNKGMRRSLIPAEDVVRTEHGWMMKSLIANLNELTDETGAVIVISSAWRCNEFEKTKAVFEAFGITGKIVGQTPYLGKYTVRGNEIAAWIEENQEMIGVYYTKFREYLILDDSNDMLLIQEPHFIHMDPHAGFSPRKLFEAKNKLTMLTNLA